MTVANGWSDCRGVSFGLIALISPTPLAVLVRLFHRPPPHRLPRHEGGIVPGVTGDFND